MLLPDDNSPTVPNAQVARPGQLNAPPPGPPVIDATGKAPIWQVARPQGAAGVGGRNTVGSFGLGFGIAMIVLAVMVLVLVIALNVNGKKGGGLGAVATVAPTIAPTQNVLTPTATALPPISNDTATGLATQFYLNISSQNLQNAYNLLSDSYQANQTIQEFQQQWQDTQQVTVDPNSIKVTPGSDNSNVLVKLSYIQVTKSDPTANNTVNATLKVGYEHNNLRILSVDTQVVPSTPTPQPSPTVAPTDVPTTPTATDTPTVSPSPTPKA
ncbi:MAG: hypothetical protein H0X24_12005 [Ktedonobacterales bacterium]|nr:hypothetical protein [Ktedonobacterales bacterium]